MNCNSCGRQYDEYIATNDMPFCGSCYVRWEMAYKTCLMYSGVDQSKSDDPRFQTASDTYTVIASEKVQECLAELVIRDPVYEESIDIFRRKQYKKLNKFDINKIEASL